MVATRRSQPPGKLEVPRTQILYPNTQQRGYPSYLQSPNPHTIVDAKKCLLTGAWCGYPLKGSASIWPIQIQILTANHWTGDPDGRARGRTKGAEGDCNCIWRTISTSWATQSSQELNHQRTEDCLIWHQWVELPLVLWRLDARAVRVGEWGEEHPHRAKGERRRGGMGWRGYRGITGKGNIIWNVNE